jgi:hypothetical protein
VFQKVENMRRDLVLFQQESIVSIVGLDNFQLPAGNDFANSICSVNGYSTSESMPSTSAGIWTLPARPGRWHRARERHCANPFVPSFSRT